MLFTALKAFFGAVSHDSRDGVDPSRTDTVYATYSRRETTLIIALAILVGAIGCGLYIAQTRSIHVLETEIRQLAKSSATVTASQNKNTRLALQLTQFEDALAAPTKFQIAYETLATAIPEHSWVSELHYNRHHIMLGGHSTNIRDLVQSLSGSAIIERVELDALQTPAAPANMTPYSVRLILKNPTLESSDG